MGDSESSEPQRSIETDSRFPSGEWQGFWRQRNVGRGKMELCLTFCEGRIQGEGRDFIGEFAMRGRYELKSGKVTMQKAYVGQHEVFYAGGADEKGIWGVWHIVNIGVKGGWHIWPKGMADPTGSTLEAEEDLPVEEAASR